MRERPYGTCPTCGQRVRVVTSDEGTSYFAHEAERERDEARAEVERLRGALEGIKRAAIQYGVNDEVGATIAHAEVVARAR
jgi:uncharacterized Zn finger protein (UPF0148 family)